MRRIRANLSKGEVRREALDGRAYVVVPVIMARGDVVMNATLVPPSELEAFAWNGVPVTLRHPQSEGGSFLSANTPETLSKYRIGLILNAKVADGALRAEAWLDEELTNKKAPGLIANLESGAAEINVSTGFFSSLEEKQGHMNGRDYEAIHHDIRPDHLAVLPDELGACSYADGCGLRSNVRGLSVNFMQMWAALSAEVAKWNSADLAKLDLSLRGNEEKTGEGEEPEPKDQPKEDETMKPEEIAALVAKTLSEGLAAFKAETEKSVKDSLAAFAATQAKALEAAERPGLVEKVVAYSAITKEQAEAMDFAALKVVANGLRPATVANFGARALPALSGHVAAESDEEIIKSMSAGAGVVSIFQAAKKEAA